MAHELSLQQLQTISGGNYLDNLGKLNPLVAAKVLPKINVGIFSEPEPTPWKVKVPSIVR